MKKLLLALAFCAAPLTAHAQLPFVLQSWVTPSAGQQLNEFWWSGLSASDPYSFGLFTFDGSVLTSPALWQTSGMLPVESSDVQHVLVNPGLMLTGDTRYAIGVIAAPGSAAGAFSFVELNSCTPGDGGYILSPTPTDHYWQPVPCSGVPYFGFEAPTNLPVVTPEPASLALLGTGLLSFAGVGSLRRSRREA